jgi:cellulose synthase/poly-beta-1,6-N-acetylglucosamine synthase-like glycosyltransferase
MFCSARGRIVVTATAGVVLLSITITGLTGRSAAHPAIVAVELVLFTYFLVVNAIDFVLIGSSLRHLAAFIKVNGSDGPARLALQYAMPVSIVIPAYNEQQSIVDVVQSLLALDYPEYELIVVNDGSTDATLELLARHFALIPAGEAQFHSFRTKPIRSVYRSTLHPNVRVIDKENGGKGDALNAGIDESHYPMILVGDGDSLYTPDVLQKMIRPFLESPQTVGCGAGLRVLTDATHVAGAQTRDTLPRNPIVRFQILEYLRAGLNSRFAWSSLNGIPGLSGACSLWRKNVLVAVGGYAVNTIWEDMEITVRVHHYLRALGTPYRIAFVPAGVCWTHVPETLAELAAQRKSWQRHLTETLWIHRKLVFSSYGGLFGWFALPAIVVTEFLAPIWLFGGLSFVVAAAGLGILSVTAQLALLAIVFSFTLLKVAFAFILDEVSYRTQSPGAVWALFCAAFWEQIGYRQLSAVWGLIGTLQFFAASPIRGKRENVPRWTDPPYIPKERSP